MFGFELDDDEANEGSQWRFGERIKKFRRKGKSLPRTQHYFWWIIHNAVAHMFLALLPMKAAFKFHDWTSRKLNAE